MMCPFAKDDCLEYGCALWSSDYEECALLLVGEGIKEISFAVDIDNANDDCGIHVHVTKEERVKVD